MTGETLTSRVHMPLTISAATRGPIFSISSREKRLFCGLSASG